MHKAKVIEKSNDNFIYGELILNIFVFRTNNHGDNGIVEQYPLKNPSQFYLKRIFYFLVLPLCFYFVTVGTPVQRII